MQLDKTRIVIRQRGLLEICDLALRVTRTYAGPLLATMVLGALPLAVIHYLLIGAVVDPDYYTGGDVARYIWNMTQLVYLTAPLATVPVTLYLGEAMFMEQPTAGKMIRWIWQLLGRIVVCQVLLRGIQLSWIMMWTIAPEVFSVGEGLLPLLSLFVLVLRSTRPYLNEIILLERNPLRASGAKHLTIARRSSKLHRPNTGDLIARSLGSVLLAVLLTVSLALTFWFMQGTFLGNWDWGPVMIHICLPASMWLVAGFFAVVRFLSYLDLRIRREGWAVELRLRAEAARLERQWG